MAIDDIDTAVYFPLSSPADSSPSTTTTITTTDRLYGILNHISEGRLLSEGHDGRLQRGHDPKIGISGT